MWVFWTLRDTLCVAGSGSGRGPCESGRAAAPARGWAAGRPSLRPQRSRSHGARGGSAWCPRPRAGPAHCAPTPALRTVSARPATSRGHPRALVRPRASRGPFPSLEHASAGSWGRAGRSHRTAPPAAAVPSTYNFLPRSLRSRSPRPCPARGRARAPKFSAGL